MKLNKLHSSLLVFAFAVGSHAKAQLTIDNAQFFIQPGATVTVLGDVTSNTDILGTGLLQMKGTALQNINMNGFIVPNLEIDNTNNVVLTGAAKVSGVLTLTNGKLQLGANNFTLTNTASFAGTPGTNKFVETNSSGQLIKLLSADAVLVELPIGTGSVYRPAFITSTGTYSNANVGVRVLSLVDANKPPMISDYLATNWQVTKAGITGTVSITGQYADADINGTEANLRGYFFNGTDWSSSGEAHDAALNRVTAPISSASGDLFGMDKFVLANAKAFLQGPYNSVTGVMSDALRTPSNLIPLSDPYRVAPYAGNFTHVSNSTTETANASVFADQALTDNNIVDWIFLELRSSIVSPGNTVLQTRSALLKRNGSIVDIDGVSPVTFNNVDNGNYTVAVRHRNHLGISADPATNLLALAEQKSTAPLLDLTTAPDVNIYGTSAAFNIVGGKNVMWAGNANFNGLSNYSALGNDRIYLLNTVLGGSTIGSVAGYSPGDLNMNRIANYSALGNDRLFLLNTVLSGSTIGSQTQALPN
jgi:hypothetical protein